MKKLSLALAVMLVFLMAFTAVAQDEPLKVVSVINGTLGDKSFFDSAQRGMDAIADEYDIEIDTVELGIDPANWEPGLAGRYGGYRVHTTSCSRAPSR